MTATTNVGAEVPTILVTIVDGLVTEVKSTHPARVLVLDEDDDYDFSAPAEEDETLDEIEDQDASYVHEATLIYEHEFELPEHLSSITQIEEDVRDAETRFNVHPTRQIVF